MQRSVVLRTGIILTFLTLATITAAFPATGPHLAPPGTQIRVNAADILGHLRSWLSGIWPKNGCGADPNGLNCGPSSSPLPLSPDQLSGGNRGPRPALSSIRTAD
jgi:hypothetical protein